MLQPSLVRYRANGRITRTEQVASVAGLDSAPRARGPERRGRGDTRESCIGSDRHCKSLETEEQPSRNAAGWLAPRSAQLLERSASYRYTHYRRISAPGHALPRTHFY